MSQPNNSNHHAYDLMWFGLIDFLLQLECISEKTHEDTYFDEDYMSENYN